MSLHVPHDTPRGVGEADGTIAQGRFVMSDGTGALVIQATGPGSVVIGVSSSTAVDGDSIRCYIPGDYAMMQCGQALDITVSDDRDLTCAADGQAVKADGAEQVLARWCPVPGEGNASAESFIKVLVLGFGWANVDA